MDIPAGPDGDAVGFGFDGKPFFWMGEGKSPAISIHAAFAASSHIAIDAFYIAPLGAGGGEMVARPPTALPHGF